MESSTKILRRMLDERGVWHEDIVDATLWKGSDGTAYTAAEVYTRGNMKPSTKKLVIRHMATPEQAIAVTLGHGAGRGECHDSNRRFNAWQCSECGATLLLMFDDCGEPTYSVGGFADMPRYCPNCGRRIVEVDE